MVNTDTLAPGMIITYKLLPEERPTRPGRLWRGRVRKVQKSPTYPHPGLCWVTSMEEGYEGLVEVVAFRQIVKISIDTPQPA